MHYQLTTDKIYLPPIPISHRNEEYDPANFEMLHSMQERHFWYRGRHRFLLSALDCYLDKGKVNLSGIDLGGGIGGWMCDLHDQYSKTFSRLALADSSLVALRYAESLLPNDIERYQIDLMNLQMNDEWDIAFLLDVIEHLPDDVGALREIKEALNPGGLLFITAPAFQLFWSYNDEIFHHLRRYRCSDFMRLANESGFRLLDARYFMFFLSPLYLAARMGRSFSKMSLEEKKSLVEKQHKIPHPFINSFLEKIFSFESPLGHSVRFPWGTSILGVFQKI